MKFKSFGFDASDICVNCNHHLVLHKRQKCPNRYWLIAYTWFGAERNFSNAVIKKHPMKHIRGWYEKYNGNNDSVLLNYWEVDEETAKEMEEHGVDSYLHDDEEDEI